MGRLAGTGRLFTRSGAAVAGRGEGAPKGVPRRLPLTSCLSKMGLLSPPSLPDFRSVSRRALSLRESLRFFQSHFRKPLEPIPGTPAPRPPPSRPPGPGSGLGPGLRLVWYIPPLSPMTPGASRPLRPAPPLPAPCPAPCYPLSRKAVLAIFLSRGTCMFWGVFEDLFPLAWVPFTRPFLLAPLPLPCLPEVL